MSELNQETITFGKYKNKTLKELLKDRNYCEWIKNQKEIKDRYEYIYNRICEYNPSIYFFKEINDINSKLDFIKDYKYFNLIKPYKLTIKLEDNDYKSYEFYYNLVKDIKKKLINRIEDGEINPYDIKAPTNWLNKYENETGLNRECFKNFIKENDLDNITSIIETIKKQGGIEYKSAQSFKISKDNSLKQEIFWEKILKEKYGENISSQFQYKNCFFDFINISTNTIYECKLGIKDFNKLQYDKYILTLDKYKIIYLIGYNTIININDKKIYIKDIDNFILPSKSNYSGINSDKNESKNFFINLISNFEIIKIDDLNLYI